MVKLLGWARARCLGYTGGLMAQIRERHEDNKCYYCGVSVRGNGGAIIHTFANCPDKLRDEDGIYEKMRKGDIADGHHIGHREGHREGAKTQYQANLRRDEMATAATDATHVQTFSRNNAQDKSRWNSRDRQDDRGQGGGSPRHPNPTNSGAPARRESSSERTQRTSLGRPQGPGNRNQQPRSVIFNKERLDTAAAAQPGNNKGRFAGAAVNNIDADPHGDDCDRSPSDEDREQDDFDGQYEAIDPAPGNDW